VENGREVLESLDRCSYQLILMDLQMPHLDGLETTRRIRKIKGAQPIVVAMTANAYPEQKAECLAAGMDDFITKPFSQEELRRTLVRHFGGQPAAEYIDPKNWKKSMNTPASLFDLSSLREISGGDASFMAIVLQKTVDSLKTGRLDMEAAGHQKAYRQLFELAHKLKSTTLNVGAGELSETLGRLEKEAHAGERGERIAGLCEQCVEGIGILIPALEVELQAWMSRSE
jgi:two-component system sensor histidine kinase BarA